MVVAGPGPSMHGAHRARLATRQQGLQRHGGAAGRVGDPVGRALREDGQITGPQPHDPRHPGPPLARHRPILIGRPAHPAPRRSPRRTNLPGRSPRRTAILGRSLCRTVLFGHPVPGRLPRPRTDLSGRDGSAVAYGEHTVGELDHARALLHIVQQRAVLALSRHSPGRSGGPAAVEDAPQAQRCQQLAQQVSMHGRSFNIRSFLFIERIARPPGDLPA